jgi:hypothetical protein
MPPSWNGWKVDIEYVDQQDDQDCDQEDDEDDDDEEEKEEKGFYSASAVEGTARFMCAMLSSLSAGRRRRRQQQQQQQHDNAKEHLQHFPLAHRLHPNVWHGLTTTTTTTNDSTPTQTVPVSFRPKQCILPTDLYQAIMLKTFAPDAVFWKESDYKNRGYYSFFSDTTTTTRNKQHGRIW